MEQAKTLDQGEIRQGERQKPHPLFIAAAVAVLLFCVLGAAALTGILPTATSRTGDPVAQQQPVAEPASPPSAVAPATPAAKPKVATPATRQQHAAAPCASCGVIQSINPVEVKGKTTGIGAVAGGVAGGLVGNAIGGGHGVGNAVLTVGGAAGGAFAGDAIEGHVKKQTVWRVTVRLDDGSVRTLQQSAQPAFAIGDRVRIVDGKGIERA